MITRRSFIKGLFAAIPIPFLATVRKEEPLPVEKTTIKKESHQKVVFKNVDMSGYVYSPYMPMLVTKYPLS